MFRIGPDPDIHHFFSRRDLCVRFSSLFSNLTIFLQCEVLGGAILQQTFIVEYTVAYQMCSDCHRVEAKVTKHSHLQIRIQDPVRFDSRIRIREG
jgi:NMD protein affecting ribosome stability and mRNA decay